MIYGPGETIVHRNTIAGDTTRATESFAIRPADGQSPMDAMLAGIEQWNHRHPDRWDTVTTPGEYRMMDPTTGRDKTPTQPTVEQDAEATGTPRETEPTKETEQGRDHDEAGSPAADPGAKAEPPETTRRDDPERRHTDLKSTLDRFHTRLRENLDGLNTATPAPGIDRNHGQRKTL
ncbi:hypothetical protein [Bifidobacterium breve]|uniref:hypothetical protein n=1 Tax=Bifidobacterium breve TaxID=1685 RepID=UPI0022AE9509|nr:hypothetical protein [Bifidobacterium breve]MCZ4447804.1 hypothetical protein [Bifidobacterium breve]MCZ4456921.1 hypothetical protein [Bifidobacterium breve]